MIRSTSLIPNVLTIAGSDSGGGAGIQADLKTFAALGCYGLSAVTALTAQNTRGVDAVHLPPPDFVARQIATVFDDIEVAAVKVGMLGSAAIVEAVTDALRPHAHLPIVVDPVLVATSGAALGDDEVVAALLRSLLPIARLATPNLAEAARLAGSDAIGDREGIEAAACKLHRQVACAWLVKGGHGSSPTADDLLLDTEPHWLSSPRVPTRNTHGTGCTLSSAIAAFLALGRGLPDAVAAAKAYLDAALAGADSLQVGHGAGPVDHFVRSR